MRPAAANTINKILYNRNYIIRKGKAGKKEEQAEKREHQQLVELKDREKGNSTPYKA